MLSFHIVSRQSLFREGGFLAVLDLGFFAEDNSWWLLSFLFSNKSQKWGWSPTHFPVANNFSEVHCLSCVGYAQACKWSRAQVWLVSDILSCPDMLIAHTNLILLSGEIIGLSSPSLHREQDLQYKFPPLKQLRAFPFKKILQKYWCSIADSPATQSVFLAFWDHWWH